MNQRTLLCLIGLCLFLKKAQSQCYIWTLSATASNCLSGSNLGSYEVTGSLTTWPAPSTGTLTISGGNGTSATYSAPFNLTIDYTLPVTAGYGNNYTVTASYSAASCDKQKSYTSPKCCDVTVPSNSLSVCESKVLPLSASGTSTGTYTWSGPNGFSSTQQNPLIPNMSSVKAGTYQVYLVNGSCTTPPVTVNVSLKAKPGSKNIKHW